MKQYILLFLFQSLFLFAFSQANQVSPAYMDSLIKWQEKQEIGKPLGDFKAAGDDGQITNKDFKGKVVFIDIWENNCAPCLAEMTGWSKLIDTLKDKKNFIFISLTTEDAAGIKKIKERYKIKFKIYHLNWEDFKLLFNQGFGFPTHIVLDQKGTIKYFKGGGNTDEKYAQHEILTDFYKAILKELQK